MNKKVKLYKIGKFYNAYGDDGYILHELLGYKFIEAKQSAGFPTNSLSKVETSLTWAKISYEIYENGIVVKSFKGLNKCYVNTLKKSLNNIETEKRINRLKKKIDNLSKEDLDKILYFLEQW